MKPIHLGLLAGAGAVGAAVAIRHALTDDVDVKGDLRKHDAVEQHERAQAERRRVGAFAGRVLMQGRGDDTYQAKLGAKLIERSFTDLGDAMRAAQQLGPEPHAVVPFTRSLWTGDGQAFSSGDRVMYDVYAVDPDIRAALGTYGTSTSHTELLDGAWVQHGADVWGMEPWDGGYSDEPRFTRVATLPEEPEPFQWIQDDIGGRS